MFHPLSLYIATRYLRAKKRNSFISFISFISMIGIALGVMVLITVLSVMNGFDEQIRNRVFTMAPQLTITSLDGVVANWQQLRNNLSQKPHVVASAPYVQSVALLNSDNGGSSPTALFGIEPQYEQHISALSNSLIAGKLTDLTPGSFGVILGRKLAATLGVVVGDQVLVLIRSTLVNPMGLNFTERHFVVKGIFDAGNGFAFNSSYAFINLSDAQKLLQLGQYVNGIRLKLDDVYKAPALGDALQAQLGDPYIARDWSQDYKEFFDAIRLEKTMMFFILILIIAVAAFNLVATLVMLVNDKRADIAILRTQGMTPAAILRIFIWQGVIVGLIGTLLGLAGGLLLAANATVIVNHLESWFNVQILKSGAYIVDYLPSHILASDVIHVCSLSLILSLVATIYPAISAARTQPAEALRYE